MTYNSYDRSWLLGFIALLTFPIFAAFAQNSDQAWQAIDNKDYGTAIRIFQQLANKGNADGEYGLGYMFWRGLGEERNMPKALDHLRRAAKQDHDGAKIGLGYIYLYGVGVPVDLAQAEYWYQQGADVGAAYGYNGVAYVWALQGKNLPKALEFINKALTSDPQDPEMLDTKGWILYQMQEYDQAFHFVCPAVLGKPGDPELRLHLGDVYWALGLSEKAKQEWTQGLSFAESPYLMTDESKEYIDGQGVENWRQSLQGRLMQLEAPNPQMKIPPENAAAYDCLRPIS